MKRQNVLLIVLTSIFLLSCKANFFSKLMHGEDDMYQFTANDQDYFPKFIHKMFPNAISFQRDYPSIQMARDGMKVVEVMNLSSPDLQVNESNLSWSEDGALLGFEVAEGPQKKIRVKDLTSGRSKELQVKKSARDTFLEGITQRSMHSYNASLRWAKDSKRYAFMSNSGQGQYNIFVGSIDAKEQPVTRNQEKNGFAAWNQKTDEIAYVSAKTGSGDIYLTRTGQKEEIRVTRDLAPDIFPEWSPDGLKIFYTSGDSSNHDVKVVERKSIKEPWSEPKRVTASSFDELRPVVSPDGRYVAFYVGRRLGKTEEFRWDIAVTELSSRALSEMMIDQKLVAKDVVVDLNTGPAWSPDSSKIFFVKRDMEAFNPIWAYELFSGRNFVLNTKTKMNRDILVSRLGVLSFRAQVGAWDKVFLALTNQGMQLQQRDSVESKIVYLE